MQSSKHIFWGTITTLQTKSIQTRLSKKKIQTPSVPRSITKMRACNKSNTAPLSSWKDAWFLTWCHSSKTCLACYPSLFSYYLSPHLVSLSSSGYLILILKNAYENHLHTFLYMFNKCQGTNSYFVCVLRFCQFYNSSYMSKNCTVLHYYITNANLHYWSVRFMWYINLETSLNKSCKQTTEKSINLTCSNQ